MGPSDATVAKVCVELGIPENDESPTTQGRRDKVRLALLAAWNHIRYDIEDRA